MEIKRFPVVPWPLFWLGKPIWLGSKCKLFLSNPNFSNNSSSQFCAFGETQTADSEQSWGCWKVLGSFFCLILQTLLHVSNSLVKWDCSPGWMFAEKSESAFEIELNFEILTFPPRKGHRNSPACCSERWILHFPWDGISNHFSCNKTI